MVANLLIALLLPCQLAAAAWPSTPFKTSGRWILNSAGENVTYAGVNWPGAADTMIPEGLQYSSVDAIVAKIKSLGLNVIRLTYAIEMIDQIYENDGNDIPLLTAFTEALGTENGTTIYNDVLANNPSFTSKTTRLEVFDAIAAACAAQEIYVHLDNHVSKAEWCCSETDGNAWWGDTYFSIANWTRGISYMAEHAASWEALSSMSLRNEPREPEDNSTLDEDTYNWEYWYQYVQEGASAIHAANPDPLIFLSGLSYDTYLTPVVQGTALTPGSATFSFEDFPADKMVLELHNYDNDATSCDSLEDDLYTDGFETLSSAAANELPMIVTEWGFLMDDTTWEGVYAECLRSYLPEQQVGWMLWVLAGSYYIRSGIQDYDETWGLLTHDWSSWRSPEFVEYGFVPMINATLGFDESGLVACEEISAPTVTENSNFNWVQNGNVWVWESGTIEGTIIDEYGTITWNLDTDITSLCIIYKNDAGTVCFKRPDPYSACHFPLTEAIDNVWGYDQS